MGQISQNHILHRLGCPALNLGDSVRVDIRRGAELRMTVQVLLKLQVAGFVVDE